MKNFTYIYSVTGECVNEQNARTCNGLFDLLLQCKDADRKVGNKTW